MVEFAAFIIVFWFFGTWANNILAGIKERRERPLREAAELARQRAEERAEIARIEAIQREQERRGDFEDTGPGWGF